MYQRGNRVCATIAVIAAIMMAARIASTWRVFNDVIDEPYHIGAGIAMFEARRHVYGIQHPPLPRLVAALPLFWGGVRSGDPLIGQIVDDLRAFEVGHRALLESRMGYWSALTRARAAMLLFPILVLLYVYLLGSYIGGATVACVGTILVSTDSTLLGHGGWATTDVAACAGFLAAIYHGLRFIARPSLRRSLIGGAALGLALACKSSTALVIPALALIWLLRGKRALRSAGAGGGLAFLALFVGVLVLWAIYAFDVGTLRDLRGIRPLPIDRLPQWAQDAPLPMPTAVAGYLVLAEHRQTGHSAYLNGQVNNDGWWYYFFEAIAIKSPMAMLLGLCASLVVLSVTRSRRRWLLLSALTVPVAVFLGASVMARLNIGVRHVLPAIPFIYLLIAFCLARRRTIGMSIVLILIAFIETLAAHPDYLSFFNQFVGGPRQGEKYLLDSNLDWGQDQWRLKQWFEQNARGRVVTTQVFGNPRLQEWPSQGFILAHDGAPATDLLAVSKNYLYDLYPHVIVDEQGNRRIGPSLSWLRQRQPLARIGDSINVYDMSGLQR